MKTIKLNVTHEFEGFFHNWDLYIDEVHRIDHVRFIKCVIKDEFNYPVIHFEALISEKTHSFQLCGGNVLSFVRLSRNSIDIVLNEILENNVKRILEDV